MFDNESPSYFDSLTDLDKWASNQKTRSAREWAGVLPFVPRNETIQETLTHSKLLIGHDFKNGYSEKASERCYTFNFWNRCNTLVYFSHHRVTIPPSGWITAAHRQGVKVLGVLIFEGESSDKDSISLLVGDRSDKPLSPVSSHYAELLADVARERRFDGYLLNFERAFPRGSEQVDALQSWVSLLKSELKAKVGTYAETIWYDSVSPAGEIEYENRLNENNLKFFLAANSLFTNYWWGPSIVSETISYFRNLESSLLQDSTSVKSLRDIHFGIDVFVRNDGQSNHSAFDIYKAFREVDPQVTGLSIALFAAGWTWEGEGGKEEHKWDWQQWWSYERELWLGPLSSKHDGVDVGDFKPISSFFPSLPPPDPSMLPLYVSFCPGVGDSWFVEGKELMTEQCKGSGWTDIDKQTSLGDHLWPSPSIQWESTTDAPLPKPSASLDFNDAYNGGSSVKLELKDVVMRDGALQLLWLPVQSLVVTSGMEYEAQVLYKTNDATLSLKDSLRLSVKFDNLGKTVGTVVDSLPVPNGWIKSTVRFTCTGSQTNLLATIGIIFPISPNLCIHLGQISIYPASPEGVSSSTPQILRAEYALGTQSPNTFIISWETSVDVNGKYEAPVNDKPQQLPSFLYFNIFAQPKTGQTSSPLKDEPVLIGVSGADGRDRFRISRDALPSDLQNCDLRFYIQGVTDRGVVLPLAECNVANAGSN